MFPSVTQLVAQQLGRRLWARWYGSAHPSPWPAANTRTTSRLLAIRQRRAQNLTALLWWIALPFLPALGQLTAWVARRRSQVQSQAARAPTGVTIAVGNWIAGGAGKTPVCIALATALRARGLSPAILTRGYRANVGGIGAPGRRGSFALMPAQLAAKPPSEVGDEAWLLAWRTGCPIGVGADRAQAAQAVLRDAPEVSVWILDDGLSQTSLRPDIRVLVLDERGHGNGRPMPDGPLRGGWPPNASNVPDAILAPAGLDLSGIVEPLGVNDPLPDCLALSSVSGPWLRFNWGDWPLVPHAVDKPPVGPLLAIAGIAKPESFFSSLRQRGLSLCDTIALPDHAPEILPALLRWKMTHAIAEPPTIVMTEKDAVKFGWETRDLASQQGGEVGIAEVLRDFGASWWALRIESQLPNDWINRLATRALRGQ